MGVFINNIFYMKSKLQSLLTRKKTLKKEPAVVQKPLLYAHELSVRRICKYFFESEGINFRVDDGDLLFTNLILDKIAKGPTEDEREHMQNHFSLELRDFNNAAHPYGRWVNDHEGRLATVILGTFFQDLKDSTT